jgi:hypothetical protein
MVGGGQKAITEDGKERRRQRKKEGEMEGRNI